MAKGRWERPRGLLLWSLAWLAAGQVGGECGAWGSRPLGEAEPTAHTASPGQEASQPLLQAGPRLFRCFSGWLVAEAVGEMG